MSESKEIVKIVYVLITRHTKIASYSSDCDNEIEYIYRLHGIFTTEGLQKYKREIKEIRDNHSSNWLFIIPLDRFLKEGMKI